MRYKTKVLFLFFVGVGYFTLILSFYTIIKNNRDDDG